MNREDPGAGHHRRLPRRGSSWAALLAALAVLVGPAVVLPAAPAAAAPAIALSKSAPGEVLAGDPITYTLTASNPDANPDATFEWNLALRDLLPPDTTYVAGSTSPARAGEPTVRTDPETGQQTVVWENIADLVPGTDFTLTFQVQPDPAVYPVGSTVTNPGAQAYSSTDPTIAPSFDADGELVDGTATQSASAGAATTTTTALRLTKSEPSPEGELLRGVHENTTVYTLTASTASGGAVGGLTLVDYLPAGLEFLGCGGVDNSSGPEYAGAPPLSATPTPPNCVAPTSVSTVVDPPPAGGVTFPPGVYTRVEWALPDLAAGAEQSISYAAGIPLRANAAWPDPAPPGAQQAANLDNNTGASTRETLPEGSLTNRATLTGTYDGPLGEGGTAEQTVGADSSVQVEDVRMRKQVSPGTFVGGGIATYTLLVDASEYAAGDALVLTDTIPAGVCPLGGVATNYADGAPAECAGALATAPSQPFDTVVDNGDGTFTVTFQPVDVPAGTELVVTYYGRMLPEYLAGPLAGQPTSAGESFTNRVELAGSASPVPGTGESGAALIGDDSSATQSSTFPTFAKTMQPRSQTGLTCPTDPAQYADPDDLPADETSVILGDRVCFRLRATFPAGTQTRDVVVSDFLPRGLSLVAGSAQDTDLPGGTVAAAKAVESQSETGITWLVGSPVGAEPRFVPASAVFDVVLQARVTSSTAAVAGEVRANQMKIGSVLSSGEIVAARDTAPVTVSPAPPVRTVKGVAEVDEPASGPHDANTNVDGELVNAGSTVTFRVDLTNDGTGLSDYGVGGGELWDALAAGMTCDDVSNTRLEPTPAQPPTVECTDPGDGDHPAFTGSDTLSLLRVTQAFDPANPALLLPGETVSVLYDVAIPDDAGVSTVYTDTASVRSYQAVTNSGEAATFYPQQNVDPTVPAADQLAPPATDSSNVRTPGALVDKSVVTQVDEAGNALADQATIGELVTWTYGVTIPAHTSVFGGTLTDALPAGFAVVPDAEVVFHPDAGSDEVAALPVGVAVDPLTGALALPATYVNDTDLDQRLEVTLVTRVTDAALATGQNAQNRANTATFRSLLTPGGSQVPPVSATATVNLRQPAPTVAKTAAPTRVTGGQTVAYTVTATNPGGDRPPLHDAFVVDCVPQGLAFAAYGADPGRPPEPGDGANGCAAGTTRLVWDLGDLDPGQTATRAYTATVEAEPVGGVVYSNTAVLSGSTLDDDKTDPDAADNPDERSYAVSASANVQVAGAGITKSVTPGQATIGERVTWTVVLQVPPDTVFFDGAFLDQLPAGLADVRVESGSCQILSDPPTACPNVGQPTVLTPAPQPDGSTRYGFLLGDAAAIPFPRELQVVYSGVVADEDVNVAGRALTNTVEAAWNQTDGRTPTSADAAFDETSPPASATVTVLEPALTIGKAVDDATPAPGQPFDYTLTVVNSSAATASAAFGIVVVDEVPTGVVVDAATISSGGVLSGADPTTGGGTITWTDPLGGAGLEPADSLQLTYTAVLAPSPTIDATPLANTATITKYESLPSGGRVYAGPSSSAAVTPQFPELTVTKAAISPAPAYLDETFTWQVTVANTGGAAAYGVDVVDTLGPGWRYEPGTATVAVAGGAPVARDPLAIGRVLGWSNVGVLEPGQAVVVTFDAVPTAAVVVDPGVGSTIPQVNTARGSGEDATGSTRNLDGPYGGDPGTAQTHIDAADLTLAKTHATPVVAGGEATWTVTATNDGPDPAVGPFTVTDTLPAGVTLVSAGGNGWTCTTTIVCTLPTGAYAAGQSLPPITVVTAVPAQTPDGAELVNTAAVDGRTYDPDTTNNTAQDTAVVTTEADLAVTKAHAGVLLAGGQGTWTVDVVNNGPSVAAAPVTAADTLPAGTTFVSASGPGWTCSGAAQAVTCTRAALAPGPAPQLTIVAAIDESVVGTITNTATVTSPTTDPDESNNTDDDPGVVTTLADLAIEKSHTGDFTAGESSVYHFTVANNGPSQAAADVVVTDTLPDAVGFVGSTNVVGSWTCAAAGQALTCTLAGPLAVGATAAVDVEVLVDPEAPPVPITNTARVDSPTTDPIPGNNVDDDVSDVTVVADLAVAKSHTGDAVAGQPFSWQVVATNNGPSDSPGPLTVADRLPAGVTYSSATGAGWTCSAVGQLVTCTTPGPLAAGASAPAITVTAAVAPDAGPATLVNAAAVTGPADDPDLTNNTALDPTVVVDQANVTIAKAADPTTVPAGAPVRYTLTATNEGPSDADTAIVTDTAPVGLTPTAVDAPSGWACGIAGRVVTCAHGAAPAGGSATITVDATTDASLPPGTQLTNTARIATSTAGDDPDDNTATATVTLTTSADLATTKTHEPLTGDDVSPGGLVRFTIGVANAGPSDAAGPITVVDTLPDGFTYVSAQAPWTCSAAGPSVTCEWDTDALAVGDEAPPLVLLVATDPALPAGVVVNTATASSTTPDPVPANNTATDPVPLVPAADIAVTKVSEGTPVIGQEHTYTMTVVNAGPSDAQDVTLRDVLPRGLTLVSVDGDGWDCTAADRTVLCALDAPLPPRSQTAPITLVVDVGPEAYPQIRNVAVVRTTTPSDLLGDNEDDVTDDLDPDFDLELAKGHTGELVVGETVTWGLLVTNDGPTEDPHPISVVDVLPTGLSYVSSAGPGWTCGAAGQRVTCTHPGPLAVDGRLPLALTTSIGAAAAPAVLNTAVVASEGETGPLLNNIALDGADVTPVSHLRIDKSVASQSGQRVVYDITVGNRGPSPTGAPVVVTDDLPTGESLISVSGDGWVCSSASVIVCQYDDVLAVDEAAPPITLTVDTTAAGGTELVNVATVGGGQPDPCPTCGDSDDAMVLAASPILPVTGADADRTARWSLWLVLAGALLAGAGAWGARGSSAPARVGPRR